MSLNLKTQVLTVEKHFIFNNSEWDDVTKNDKNVLTIETSIHTKTESNEQLDMMK